MGACISNAAITPYDGIQPARCVEWMGEEDPCEPVGEAHHAFAYMMAWGLDFFAKDAEKKEKQRGYENHAGPGREVVVFGKDEGPAEVRKAYHTLVDKAVRVLRSVRGGEVASKYGFGASSLRLNKYAEEGSTCGTHTDTTLVTLICDSCTGLLIWSDHTNAWVPCAPRTITAFPGRFLYCLSDGESAAPSTHKVISSKSRLSVALFLRPDPTADLVIPRTPTTTTYNEIVTKRVFPDPWEDLMTAISGPARSN